MTGKEKRPRTVTLRLTPGRDERPAQNRAVSLSLGVNLTVSRLAGDPERKEAQRMVLQQTSNRETYRCTALRFLPVKVSHRETTGRNLTFPWETNPSFPGKGGKVDPEERTLRVCPGHLSWIRFLT